MQIKAGTTILRITKNQNNRFWNPIGMFLNQTEMQIEGEWYRVGLLYVKIGNINHVQFYHPMKVDEETSRIQKVLFEGIYSEVPVSNLKLHLLKFLQNQHKLNRISHSFRTTVYRRKRTILVFLLAFILSILFYQFNLQFENILIKYIAENILVQSILFFLTVASFISIFFPFTIKKEFSKSDIEAIVLGLQEKERINKEIAKRANL